MLWGINTNPIVAKQAVPGGGDGGGGGGNTHFANYGTYTTTVYCQRVTVGVTGIIEITYYFATVYWLKEVCVSGGSFQECTYGTVRTTYQGGGC
jgi:hypothetical protein